MAETNSIVKLSRNLFHNFVNDRNSGSSNHTEKETTSVSPSFLVVSFFIPESNSDHGKKELCGSGIVLTFILAQLDRPLRLRGRIGHCAIAR